MSFTGELKRRNVLGVALAYLAGARLLQPVIDVLIDNNAMPDWLFQTSLVIMAIGFPIALILAWALETTPAGVKLENDVDRSRPTPAAATKKFDRIVIVILAIVVAYFAFDKFSPVESRATKFV